MALASRLRIVLLSNALSRSMLLQDGNCLLLRLSFRVKLLTDGKPLLPWDPQVINVCRVGTLP